MALGQHVLSPGDALPLLSGEVDLRSKDGEGLSFIQQKERFYETIYCNCKRRGRAAFPLCPERDARSPHQPAVQELPQQAGQGQRQKGSPRGSAQDGRPEFKNVCFRYPGAKQDVIHNLNLKVKAGENIALVGVNGAGKTTLVKLLCGFYHPNEGQILIAGREISDYSETEYRKLVGAVFQDMMVMATSVAENIACEKQENIDEPKLRTAMQLADIEDKVLSLPKKEKTAVTNFLDKDGVLFSGGELQRILLARALYKDAPLLLLDEPTSALDPLAETAIYEQYHRLSEGKTTIFISHRLASTKFCDRIIYYENGQVKEDGTHDELMKKNGAYAKMFEIQSQYYNEKGGDFDE